MDPGINENFLGEDYQKYIDIDKENADYSIENGKKETGPETFQNKGSFEKPDESDLYKPQTEFNKNEKKFAQKASFMRKRSIAGNSSKDLSNILKKKQVEMRKNQKKRKK